uniref:GTP-binding protein 10 n=1 Tax=Gasterosteus aculeatus TaxID=69293 RepID=G3PF73_GASAC
MVQLSRICFRKYGDFVDNLRVYVRGGGGGMGLPRLGGKGGDGGDVWVVATKNMTLKRIKDKYPEKRFVAGAGANSRFPNAGKSSLLTAMSNATPQIASYAFTTLRPQIGKLMYEDYKQISVADLPGLIEGAHVNKGMGHKFLKHVERTKQLLFVVDVCGFQLASKTPFRSPFEAVQLLTKELELYKEELVSKPALLVVNKMDLPDAEDKLAELKQQLQNPDEFSHLLPDDMMPKSCMTFRHIVPVSATTGFGVDRLKRCIRESLDDDAATATNDIHQDRL